MKKLLPLFFCFPLLLLAGAQSPMQYAPFMVRPVAAASSTLNTSLVCYWDMDEASGTRADSETTGTARNLDDNNTVTSSAGKISNAATFDAATTEYLSVSDNADISTGDIDFTFACWVNLSVVNSGDRAIFGKYISTGNQREYTLFYNVAAQRFTWRVSATGSATLVSLNADNFGAPSASTWYFVVVWHDSVNNQLGISVNNGTPNTVSHTTGVFDGTSEFTVGRYNGSSYLSGSVDEMGFWKKVLTSDERAELYNGGSGKTYPF